MASPSRPSIFGGRKSISEGRRSVSNRNAEQNEQVPDLNVQEVQSRHFPEYNNDRNFAEYLQKREFEEVIFGNETPFNFNLDCSHPSSGSGPSSAPTLPIPSETVQMPQAQPDLSKYKYELFKVHMKRVEKDGLVIVVCNYCSKDFKWNKSEGYGTYWKHINSKHPAEAHHQRVQHQISRYTSPNHPLFKHIDQNNRDQLARMVATEHLPFSFGEKTSFLKYYYNALNLVACRVPRTTLKRTMCDIYKKEKKSFSKIFSKLSGSCVCLCRYLE
ncbi:hypothetical protein ACOSQ3_010820 [Xanthoceras sorbifolium]